MSAIKIGIIGGSRIALRHLQAISGLGELIEVKGLCSRSVENSKRIIDNIKDAGHIFDSIHVYSDYYEMLNKEDLDVAVITTESGRHCSIALDCLESGVNVFVEKPMAVTLEDSTSMISKAKEKGLHIFVSQQMRFNPSVLAVKKTLDEGKFGKLLHVVSNVRWNRNKAYYEQAEWRGTKDQDGGTLLNQCIHSIDIMRWLVGSEPIEVFAYTDNLIHPEIEIEDVGLALVKFENGAYGVIEGTVNIYPKNYEETLHIFGEKGTVKLGGKSLDTIEYWNVENVKEPAIEKPSDVALYCYMQIYKNIALSLKQQDKPLVTGEEAIKTMRLIDAIYKSSDKGVPIRLL
jgi:UDP-N-acetyl-2-amino-2-deoxyglucuronate dehydrogenase